MSAPSENTTISSNDQVAYLVVRDGNKWRDVFRLTPGQVTTMGRAPTNRIVVKDEICSRNHAEVFLSGSKWTLRDLASRNGTLINGQRVTGDCPLRHGQLIQIGSYELGFTLDLSQPFPETDEPEVPDAGGEHDTAVDVAVFDSMEVEPAIIQRRRKTRYEAPSEVADRDRFSRQLAKLYRLMLEMVSTRDRRGMSRVCLDGVLSATTADVGAILLLPEGTSEEADASSLEVAVSVADGEYQAVSAELAEVVLSEREAILARDVADDSRLATRDPHGEIHAKSVICAPIRSEEVVYGLVHIYSTSLESPLDPQDLEFALAVADQLAVALDNLNERQSLAEGLRRVEEENQTLREQLRLETELVGDSPELEELRSTIGQIAPTDATVLIRGESGVGKELVSRAIHFNSQRSEGPFICMNCAALAESLLESELFGHEAGSFTGATSRKPGRFEQADRGTLFLDEVGEMSLSIQAKFLRVLEGHPFERVGGGDPIRVDVRVVAATNRDLEQAVARGEFRKDLYFRLHVVEVVVKPLREHQSDVPVLATYFLQRFARKTGRPVKTLTQRAVDALMKYRWPGNVRELQNTVERAVILCQSDTVDEVDIRPTGLGTTTPAEQPTPAASPAFRQVSLNVVEQEHILSTLQWTSWNKSKAAQILGIERSTLDRKLKRYQVHRPRPPKKK